MSLLEQNSIRNIKTDQQRISLFRKNINLWMIFSSKEVHTLWKYLKPRIGIIVFLIAASFVVALIEGFKSLIAIGLIRSLTGPLKSSLDLIKVNAFGRTIDLNNFLNLSNKIEFLFFVFTLLIVVSLGLAALKWFLVWLNQKVRMLLLRDIRKSIVKTVFSLDLDYFNQAKSGELMFLMNAETSRFSNLVVHCSNVISYSIQTIMYLVILFYFFPMLTLAILGIGLLYFIAHVPIDLKVKVQSWKTNEIRNSISQNFHQIIYGIKMIKIGALEGREFKGYVDNHEKFETENLKMATMSGLSKFAQEFLFAIFLAVIAGSVYLFKGGETFLNNPSNGSSLVEYLFILLRLVMAGVGIQAARSSLVSIYGPLSRVIEFLHLETKEQDIDKDSSPYKGISKIKVNNLNFSYDSDKETLKNINLDINKGEMVAFVGISGSGKSTMLDILSGLRDGYSGEVIVDDKKFSDLDVNRFRNTIGYMNQEPIIFHETLEKNVTFFSPVSSKDEIEKALELSLVNDFLPNLKDGLNTGLGERGQTISGGERQRIGLARMFLQNRDILFLDEATNALDYITEKKFYDNLSSIRKNRIIIVVAHRLSAIKNFDKIVVFNKGEVVETGTHSELMDRKEMYYSLYNVQEQSLENK